MVELFFYVRGVVAEVRLRVLLETGLTCPLRRKPRELDSMHRFTLFCLLVVIRTRENSFGVRRVLLTTSPVLRD